MILDHIDALSTLSSHRVDAMSMSREIPASCALEDYDAVIIHYSIFISQNSYLSPLSRYRLRQFAGPKIMFIQDEYRFVGKTIEAMSYLGIDLVFTCVPENQITTVYPAARLQRCDFVTVLTGYVPDRLRTLPALPFAVRPVDVCYRGREYPFWHGELGRDRIRIAEWFHEQAPKCGLTTDISTRECDRIYGSAWLGFLGRAKAVLGTESGCNVLDVEGTLGDRIERYRMLHPWAPYEVIRRRFLAEIEGIVHLNQISPRCFEAIATRTMLVLYEGAYSGILQPWLHYVPLRRDHANTSEVISLLRNPTRAEKIIERAHADIIASDRFSYRSFITTIDCHIARLVAEKPRQRSVKPARMAISAPQVGPRPRIASMVLPIYIRLPEYVRIWVKYLLDDVLRRPRHGMSMVGRIMLALATSNAVRKLAIDGFRMLGLGGTWSMLRMVAAVRRSENLIEMRVTNDCLLIKPRDVETHAVLSAVPFSIVWTGGPAMGVAGALGCVDSWRYKVTNPCGMARLLKRICSALSAPEVPLWQQGACGHAD